MTNLLSAPYNQVLQIGSGPTVSNCIFLSLFRVACYARVQDHAGTFKGKLT